MDILEKNLTLGFFIIAALLLSSCSQPAVVVPEKKQQTIDIKELTKSPHESYSR